MKTAAQFLFELQDDGSVTLVLDTAHRVLCSSEEQLTADIVALGYLPEFGASLWAQLQMRRAKALNAA